MSKYKDNEMVTMTLERYSSMIEECNDLKETVKELEELHESDQLSLAGNAEELDGAYTIISELLKKEVKGMTFEIEDFANFGYELVTDRYDKRFRNVVKDFAIKAYTEVYNEKK